MPIFPDQGPDFFELFVTDASATDNEGKIIQGKFLQAVLEENVP
jgi:hypothetical protein